jgi:hypothetical protein
MADTIYGPKADQPKVTLVIPPEYYGRQSASRGPAVIYAFPSGNGGSSYIPGVWSETDYQWPAPKAPKAPEVAAPVSGTTVAAVAVAGLVALALAGGAVVLIARSRKAAPAA